MAATDSLAPVIAAMAAPTATPATAASTAAAGHGCFRSPADPAR
jgi:hypothetical protein